MGAAEPRRRRDRGPGQRAAAEAARTERLEALHRQLAAGVAAIRDGQAWRGWLDTAARFHAYSFRNQVLIAAQNPDATLVAGYGAWQAMGRQVRKGEKGLWVLAPVTARRARSEQDVPGGDEPAGQEDPAPARGRGPVVGFRAAAVFDVSQTDGDPLPAPPRPQLLAGQAPPGLWDALAGAIAARGFTVGRCPGPAGIGGANGVTDHAQRTVTVRGDVDDAQAVKTLAHDLLTAPSDWSLSG